MTETFTVRKDLKNWGFKISSAREKEDKDMLDCPRDSVVGKAIYHLIHNAAIGLISIRIFNEAGKELCDCEPVASELRAVIEERLWHLMEVAYYG